MNMRRSMLHFRNLSDNIRQQSFHFFTFCFYLPYVGYIWETNKETEQAKPSPFSYEEGNNNKDKASDFVASINSKVHNISIFLPYMLIP